MCGIVAVSGMDLAAELAFLGLYSLQHRGQEAAGISAVGADGRTRLHRAHGLIVDGFDDASMPKLAGRLALGHTRYSTAGGPGPAQRAADPRTLPARATSRSFTTATSRMRRHSATSWCTKAQSSRRLSTRKSSCT